MKLKNLSLETLEAVAAKFRVLGQFVATRRVDSEAVMSLDRRICEPGDVITVERWHCNKGPTSIRVQAKTGSHRGGEFCIPFEWVMEMGASEELASYMPFPCQTWEEIIAEKKLES